MMKKIKIVLKIVKKLEGLNWKLKNLEELKLN